MNFISHLFGTIAGVNGFSSVDPFISFVPKNASGETITIKGDQATWWGLKGNKEMQKKAYEFCFPVASVIDRLAEYDIAGKIEIVRSEGKGRDNFATNSWAQNMNRLLARPNPMQTWEQFRGQQVVYKKIFGWCAVLPVVPSGFTRDNATAMVNLPPWLLDPDPTWNLTMATTLEEVVKNFRFSINGRQVNFRPDQLIILQDSFLQDEDAGFVLPQSKLVGLDMAISNICAAMEADNVLLKKKGPLGFISGEAMKDAAGSLVMSSEEKKELQGALAAYGLTLGQYQYVISTMPAKWNPMSYDVKQLGTKETVNAGEKAICHRFGFPYTLYEQQDATYANGLTAEKGLYNSNVIPNNTKDLNKYNEFFLAAENKCKIINNYDEIAALQVDRLAAAQAAQAHDAALSIEYNANLITKNQWLLARGYDSVPDGDVYKSSGESNDPLAMKLGVGGTQALIELLANPALSSEDKKNGLVILFGMNPEDANKMVSEPKQIEQL